MTASQLRRIVAATLIAVVTLSVFTALGFWQYARAHRDDIARSVYALQPTLIQHELAPGDYLPDTLFSRAVVVSGDLHEELAVTSCDRAQSDGTTGCWIVAPLMTADGHAVTIVLGFVASADRSGMLAMARARGTSAVSLTGRLQPDELVGSSGGAIMHPTDSIAYVDAHALGMLWQLPLFDGYVVAEPAHAGTAVTAPLITPPSGITWRNLLYAWQWWAFALFVVFLLARYIMDVRNEGRTLEPDSQEETS